MRLCLCIAILLSSTSNGFAEMPLIRQLCGDLAGCRKARASAAGRDEKGRPLQVLELAIANPPKEDPQFQCRPHRRQIWRLPERKLLLDLCNDGYGSARVGSDEIKVQPNRLIHTQLGGSAWRWSRQSTVQLSPLRIVSQVKIGWWVLGENRETATWDWTRPSGRVEGFVPGCPQDGEVTDERYEYSIIPQVKLDGGARPAALGSCSLTVDSSGAGGFILQGARGKAEDARMKVAMLGASELFVEIEDDVVTPEDRLELWLGPAISYLSQCAQNEEPRQWAIRVTDGKISSGAGNPDADDLTVTRAAAGATVRLKIQLPEPTDGVEPALTIIYDDTDDGKVSKRSIATSNFKPGHAATLGSAASFDSRAGQCVIENGALEFRATEGDAVDVQDPND
jgi:hypothetical protein